MRRAGAPSAHDLTVGQHVGLLAWADANGLRRIGIAITDGRPGAREKDHSVGKSHQMIDRYRALGRNHAGSPTEISRPVVCIQGLGFVGAAMALATARARDASGSPCFNVVGLDLDTEPGRERIDSVNGGRFPHATSDQDLLATAAEVFREGNLIATSDPSAYEIASVVVVDVDLSLSSEDIDAPDVDLDRIRRAVRTLGERCAPGTLVLVETTVPPGTCSKVIAPELEAALRDRGLPSNAILLAHSYERVMPGPEYLSSIINFWRVYSGHTIEAADRAEAFLSRIVDVERFPMTRLASTTASELAKVLENSYRATNIAFIEEWGRFSEQIGVDLFSVIDAIRVRPTHNNIRQPGFGVGGYCLTKDPLFAKFSARHLFELEGHPFPFTSRAVGVNRDMPMETLRQLAEALGGDVEGRRILLMGVSYRSDVGDTRHSPSEVFVRACDKAGAQVDAFDPLVERWHELERTLPETLPSPETYDAIVFAVPHKPFRSIVLEDWLGPFRPLVLDANCVLTDVQWAALQRLDCPTRAVGRGDRR